MLFRSASFIAEVFVKTAKEDLLKVYEKKKGVNFSTLWSIIFTIHPSLFFNNL